MLADERLSGSSTAARDGIWRIPTPSARSSEDIRFYLHIRHGPNNRIYAGGACRRDIRAVKPGAPKKC